MFLGYGRGTLEAFFDGGNMDIEAMRDVVEARLEAWQQAPTKRDNPHMIGAYATLVLANSLDAVSRELTQMRRIMATWDID